MAFFTYAGSKYGEAPILVDVIIANSQTVYKNGWVNFAGGFADAADATETLVGVALDVVTKDGIPLGQHLSTDIDGTWTAQSGSTTANYAAASDNQTDKMVKARVNLDPSALYYNEPDATIGTDTESDMPGSYTDIANAYQVDEDTAATTTCQLLIWGLNPGNTAQGIYMKYESQI